MLDMKISKNSLKVLGIRETGAYSSVVVVSSVVGSVVAGSSVVVVSPVPEVGSTVSVVEGSVVPEVSVAGSVVVSVVSTGS